MTVTSPSRNVIIVSDDGDLVSRLTAGLEQAELAAGPTVVASSRAGDDLACLMEAAGSESPVVIVDVENRMAAFGLIHSLTKAHPGVVTVAADQAPSRSAFEGVTEAGASAYLVPPFDLTALGDFFERSDDGVEPKQPETAGEGRILCFLPVQGGSGATTLAIHAADALSGETGSRILLLDFDFHSGTVPFRLRLKPNHTLADALEDRQCRQTDWGSLVTSWNRLDVLVSPPSNRSLDLRTLDRIPKLLASATDNYPFVVVDLPDPIYTSSRQILTAADRIYLICTPEITSLHLARRKAQELADIEIPKDRVQLVVNRVGSLGSLETEDVVRLVGHPVKATFDNDYREIREATWNGRLVSPDTLLSEQFRKLAATAVESFSVAP